MENIKINKFIFSIFAGILITAIVIGLGVYFLTNGSSKTTKTRGYSLSSVITGVSPLEIFNLVLDNQKVYLIQRGEKEESYELEIVGNYIRKIFSEFEQPSIEPEIFLFKNGNVILIEILEDTGGMAPVNFRTLFSVDISTKKEQKLYVVRESFGREGITPEPILITFFDKYDLILNCNSSAPPEPLPIEPNPSYRSLYFSDCSGVYLVENYSKREEDLKGETYFDWARTENKGFLYYDNTGKLIEPRVFSNKQGQRAIVYTSFLKLMLGRLSVAVGQGEDVESGGKNRQLFELSLDL
jgi:hypothetical protein